MSDTARDYQTIDQITTEGLEDLFVEVSEVQLHTVADAVAPQLNAVARNCTVKEASELLGVPTSTIYRRVKAGKYRIVGSDENGAQLIEVQLHAVADAVASQQNATASPQNAVAPQLHAVAAQSDTDKADLSISALLEMSNKLEAANYRIGWLESQLRERDNDIEELKLLTDSQHKAGWWHRFKKWCAGN